MPKLNEGDVVSYQPSIFEMHLYLNFDKVRPLAGDVGIVMSAMSSQIKVFFPSMGDRHVWLREEDLVKHDS